MIHETRSWLYEQIQTRHVRAFPWFDSPECIKIHSKFHVITWISFEYFWTALRGDVNEMVPGCSFFAFCSGCLLDCILGAILSIGWTCVILETSVAKISFLEETRRTLLKRRSFRNSLKQVTQSMNWVSFSSVFNKTISLKALIYDCITIMPQFLWKRRMKQSWKARRWIQHSLYNRDFATLIDDDYDF